MKLYMKSSVPNTLDLQWWTRATVGVLPVIPSPASISQSWNRLSSSKCRGTTSQVPDPAAGFAPGTYCPLPCIRY